MIELLKPFKMSNKNILDPYLGSGTTLLWCQKNRYKGLEIELKKEYSSLCLLNIKFCMTLFSNFFCYDIKMNKNLTEKNLLINDLFTLDKIYTDLDRCENVIQTLSNMVSYDFKITIAGWDALIKVTTNDRNQIKETLDEFILNKEKNRIIHNVPIPTEDNLYTNAEIVASMQYRTYYKL